MITSEKLSLESYKIPSDDRVLLSECIINTFRSSGKGGQHINKTDSAVRIRHKESGIVVTCQRERSQYQNKMICLEKLRNKLMLATEEKIPRIPTLVSQKEKSKRLGNKKLLGLKKATRRFTAIED